MDALEYGRMVHAEMSSLCDAARLGHMFQGGTLYCTTFPCHMCAKHIVAAGIARVVTVGCNAQCDELVIETPACHAA